MNTDSSLYFRMIGDRLLGLSGTYVDDLLRCDKGAFFKLCEETGKVFDSGPETRKKAKFAGVSISQEEDGIDSHMQEYIDELELPETNWKNFQSFRAKLAWLVYCRPDICARVAKSAQVTYEQLEAYLDGMQQMLKETLDQLKHFTYRLKYSKLDMDSLLIRTYADASFGSNSDGPSQLGYFVLLMDKHNQIVFVSFRSEKCYRVTHSAMAAETIAFAEAFDDAYTRVPRSSIRCRNCLEEK